MNDFRRRDFIRLSGGLLGGVLLTACGGGGDSYAQLPNGYRFYRLKSANDQVANLPQAFAISRFYGRVHISNNGILTFDAHDANKRRGIFQLGVDFNGARPRIDWESCSLIKGQTLVDGRVVSTCKTYDVDAAGRIAAVIDADLRHSEAHYGSGLYVAQARSGFNPVLLAGQSFSDGSTQSAGIFGDVAVSDGHVLTVAHHLPVGAAAGGSEVSLLHLPGGSTQQGKLLMSAGTPVTGADHNISSFGLVDLNMHGNFSAGLHGLPMGVQATASPESASSFNIAGHVGNPGDVLLSTASVGTVVNANIPIGEAGYGPRVGPQGQVFAVLDDADQMVLVRDGEVLRRSGEMSAQGELLGLSPGSVGSDGVYYYTALLANGDQTTSTLYAYNGNEHVAIVSSGNVLSDGGAPVAQILFGTTTRHVDSESRLVCLCSFEDGTTSLVVGLPV